MKVPTSLISSGDMMNCEVVVGGGDELRPELPDCDFRDTARQCWRIDTRYQQPPILIMIHDRQLYC